jgi:hypothetical protein
VVFRHNDGAIVAEDGTIVGTWTPQTWYKVKVVLDRSSNTYSVWIDGELRAEHLITARRNTEMIDALALNSAV